MPPVSPSHSTFKTSRLSLSALLSACLLSACSSTPSSNSNTNAQQSPANTPFNEPLSRRTPVVAERPARVYIWAGFDPTDCTAITPTLTIAQPPAKGTITFRPNQMTKIKQSSSGKCIGQDLYGTGIYYTGHKGQTGRDQFSITATTTGDPPVTRSFTLTIAE